MDRLTLCRQLKREWLSSLAPHALQAMNDAHREQWRACTVDVTRESWGRAIDELATVAGERGIELCQG